jgi:hypothetical protein
MTRTRIAMMPASTGVFLQAVPADKPRSWSLLADRFVETMASKLEVSQSKLQEALRATLVELGAEAKARYAQPSQGLSIIRTFVNGASRHVGLDTNAFAERLRKGESAAAIAESLGKSREGLVGALVEKASDNFGRLEAAGLVTHDRAMRELDRVVQLINRWTDHRLPAREARRAIPNEAIGHRGLSHYGGVLH